MFPFHATLALAQAFLLGCSGGSVSLNGDADALADSDSSLIDLPDVADAPDDVTSDTPPDAWDPCEGVDGPVLLGPSISLATESESFGYFQPSITWTGSEYSIAWIENGTTGTFGGGTLYLTRLDPHGSRVAEDRSISRFAHELYGTDIAWTGSMLGIAFGSAQLSVVDPYGEVLGQAEYPCCGGPVMAWTGSSFGVAVGADGPLRLYDWPSGTSITLGHVSTPSSSYGCPGLAWTGSELGVSWFWHHLGDAMELHFARVNPSMVSAAGDVILDSGGEYSATRLAWTGSEFGLFWPFADEIDFMRVSSLGEPIGDIVRIIAPGLPSQDLEVVWTGSEFGVFSEATLFYVVGPTGEVRGAPVAVSSAPPPWAHGDMVWTGSEAGIVWSWMYFADDSCSDADGHWICPMDLYFSRIGICGP